MWVDNQFCDPSPAARNRRAGSQYPHERRCTYPTSHHRCALDQLATEGYDPEMGARPLRRVIQQKIEENLSDRVLAKEFSDGDTIWVDVDKEKAITLKKKKTVRKTAPEPETAEAKI
jgi:hypothetical protein